MRKRFRQNSRGFDTRDTQPARDTQPIWRRFLAPGALLVLAALVFALTRLAQGAPEVVERVYARGIYPVFAQALSSLTGLLPVSLSEVLLCLLPLLLFYGVVRAVRGKIHWTQLLMRLVCGLCALYLVFALFWGLNYSRLPYAQVAGLEVRESGVETLRRLVTDLAAEANALKEEMGGGAVALTEEERWDVLRRRVNEAYAAAGEIYPFLSGRYGAPKFALLSTPLAHLNIAGIFSPFTLEAHVNAHEADALLAATAAHEGAHLRGFAREDEANFIAYAVCRQSGDVYVRYSGTLLALIYAGNALSENDPAAYAQIWAGYSEGVRADLRHYNAAWEPYDGQAAQVHEKVNDAYLKANGQADGVRSYGRMVDLLIAERYR